MIVSDAFRYEAAQELTEQLNGKYRHQRGAVGAAWGTAVLYRARHGGPAAAQGRWNTTRAAAIRVDGLPCGSLEQRGKVLESVRGVAVKAEAFMAMKKDEGRAFIKPYRVIYVYHNQVDAVGDSASTEDHTFDAVRTRPSTELARLGR